MKKNIEKLRFRSYKQKFMENMKNNNCDQRTEIDNHF